MLNRKKVDFMIIGKTHRNFCISFLLAALITLPAFLSAQTADEIELLLSSEALSYEQAARFVLEAADVTALSSPSEAFSYAAEQQWLPKKAAPDAQARLDGVSLLIMRSFNIKGGIFYSMVKNPHYAYREMVHQDVILGRAGPEMPVSGDMLLFMVSRILTRQEDEAQAASERAQRLLAAEEEKRRRDTEAATAAERSARRAAEQEALAAQINTELSASAVTDASARITEQGVTISLSNIQFQANSAELPESERRKLQEITRILQTIPNRRILVTGHTAMAGTAEDQLRTSQDRAASVAAYLVFLGARNSSEVFSQGFGSERPVANNDTQQGMALNRRVEITILEDM